MLKEAYECISIYKADTHMHQMEEKKKIKDIAFQKALLGVLSIDIQIPFPQR